MLFVIMSNSGGELDREPVPEGSDATTVLLKMIVDCGEVVDGDTFAVVEEE